VRLAFDVTPARMNPAGTGRYVRGLLAAFAARGEPDVLTVEATRRSPANAPGRIALGLAREGYWYPLGLDRRARRAGADVVHVPAGLGPTRPRLPLVVTIHDVLPLRHPEWFTAALVGHVRHVLPRIARAAARVVTVSEHARGEIVELMGVPAERVVAVHNGIDAGFAPREPDDEWLERRFGLRRPYVLSTGTLEPRKNLRAVLDAMPALPDDVSLAVAGGHGWHAGPIEDALERFGGRAKRLGFVGDGDLAALYAGAACFVFPSLGEGFGLPPLEAMACGAPVVCSDRTSLPEVVGDAAVLVDPEDPGALVAAVRGVLADPARAEDLRRRGIERARGFTWERAAERTAAVYREAAGS
jgi:glycosyltransferase involved in cell wall biosynthesis